jgi:Integrase core domain
MQNAFIESFNGRLRDELLNETLFTSLVQARVARGCWRVDYNDARPHSQLGWKTPSEFAFTFHPRRTGQIQQPGRTLDRIKLGGKVSGQKQRGRRNRKSYFIPTQTRDVVPQEGELDRSWG